MVVSLKRGPRRFPPPWRTEPIPAGRLVVDANGTRLAFIYGVDTRAQTTMSSTMNFEQAVGVAAAVVELPAVIRGERPAPVSMQAPFRVDERDGCFRW